MNKHFAVRARWFVSTLLSANLVVTGRGALAATPTGVAPANERSAGSSPDDGELSGQVLARAAFVSAVLRRSPSIESARQAWRAAVARTRRSGVFDDPEVELGIAPLSIGSSTARLGWEATVSQRLPWPGKLGFDEAISRAEADAVGSDLEASRRDLALAASLLFDDYFVDVWSIEVNAQHVVLMRSMQAAATVQYEAGRGSSRDPLQAEFELAHMEHDAVVLASQRDVAIAQMNELLHRAPETPLPLPPAELLVEPPADAADAQRLETEAIERRPDIAAARQRERAEQARADRGSRDSFPDFTMSTSYNSMWDTPEHRWMIGLAVSLPIFGDRRAGAVDEANAMRAQYQADAARKTDATRTQVAVALKRLEEAGHVLHLYDERLVPIARDEVDAARGAFIVSQAPFTAVVDAEKNLRSVELDRRVVVADCDRRRAELDYALGRISGLGASGATASRTGGVAP
jgi:outer membrane protein, heavy metal efflux system